MAVVHSQNKLQSNVAALYVDGSLREQRELRSGLSLKDAVLNQVENVTRLFTRDAIFEQTEFNVCSARYDEDSLKTIVCNRLPSCFKDQYD